MQGATQERLKVLCEQAATEKDPDKFLEIIREINDMLELQRVRLSAANADRKASNDGGNIS
jgi:hypothetical protein